MNVTAAMLVEGGRRARLCEAFNWNAGARGWMPLGRMTLGTPPGPSDRAFMDAGAGCKVQMEHRKMAFTLSGASVCGRRGRAIRKKIIGHGMFASRERFSRKNVLLPVLRAFPLLHMPPISARRLARFSTFGDHVAGFHGAVNRFAVGIAAGLIQEQALLQDRAGKLIHHPRLLEHTAPEPVLEFLRRSDSTFGKGH